MRREFAAAIAVVVICLCLFNLERGRAGLEISGLNVGTAPATLYRLPGSQGPVVVVAHGFAGSRQIMQAYSLTLAQAGYQVRAFDFEGHGSNPMPMSGDVTSVDGTTALLVAETRRVIAAARALPGGAGGVALLGHPMATDIILRAANAEAQSGQPITAVVAISMFSQAVTAQMPPRLLVISGEWESGLRQAALTTLRTVQPEARENQTVTSAGVIRRDVVAPQVEHVSARFSPTAISQARAWLDTAFGRTSPTPIVAPGPWILALLFGIVALIGPVVLLLPQVACNAMTPPEGGAAERVPPVSAAAPQTLSANRFLAAILVPSIVMPVVLPHLYSRFLPVLVANYLLLHLAAFGAIQPVILRVWPMRGPRDRVGPAPWAIAALVLWGIVVFGLALDRYAANVWPTPERLVIIAALALGTVPFMAVGQGQASPAPDPRQSR